MTEPVPSTMTGARGPARSPSSGGDAGSSATLDAGPPEGARGLGGVAPGQILGRFQVLEPVGQGGMGTVFSAHDERLDRKVALKVIRGDGDPRRRARMLREAQALAKLSHPNVVAIYEVGERAHELYIAMELIEGPTLRKWVRDRSWTEVLDMYVQAGRGLAAAHAQGLVHRDFKPDNVMVGPEDGVPGGRPRVLDFGLARLHDAASSSVHDRSHADDPPAVVSSGEGLHTPLTMTGARMGTPAYMAP
ncbi:MAG: serine/threonine protein kinase, partial [Deltaproteobacteria bacterium]|nr:serine/threonine protein kinase [Deltaproteobacteria bacterium]